MCDAANLPLSIQLQGLWNEFRYFSVYAEPETERREKKKNI